MQKVPLLILLGPTASGKTRLAAQLAFDLGGEIISADSRQVYRQMNIGTGKDLNEYVLHGKSIPHHLIDILPAGEQYNVNRFQLDFEDAYNKVVRNAHVPIICGGTGFYINSLLKSHAYSSIPVDNKLRDDLQNASAQELLYQFEKLDTSYSKLADISTRKRLIRAIEISQFLLLNGEVGDVFCQPTAYEYIVYGLNPEVTVRRESITNRLRQRLESGLIGEVEGLLQSGLTSEQLIYYGLEYKFITLYLTKELTYAEMFSRLETEIHRFAKRQMTFFRKMEKDGILIHWLDSGLTNTELAEIMKNGYKQLNNVGL